MQKEVSQPGNSLRLALQCDQPLQQLSLATIVDWSFVLCVNLFTEFQEEYLQIQQYNLEAGRCGSRLSRLA